MYLKIWKEVAKADLPSFSRMGMHEMSWILLVKGAATEASDSDRDIPVSAVLRAIQSLAPSPHIPTSTLTNFCSC